jgi:hypothetical protein
VHFVDADHGWAIGENQSFGRSSLFRTTTGGR